MQGAPADGGASSGGAQADESAGGGAGSGGPGGYAGNKHQPCFPAEATATAAAAAAAVDEAAADDEAPVAEAVQARLAQLDDDFKSKQQHEAKLMAQLVEMRADPDLADTIPTLEAKLSKKHEELTRLSDQKRKLRDALAEDTAAAEEEQAAEQRRRATQTALAAAWRASVQCG